ncbi:MAG: hypothetical protein SGPRY_009298, partial [Prymnesium sp.]
PEGDLFLCGCFGSSLFALRARSGEEVWRGHSEGPLFATPRADIVRRQVYCADLRGCLLCLEQQGDEITPSWRYHTTPRAPPYAGSEPIFSSPLVCNSSGNVCFGCTDCKLHCLSPRGQARCAACGGVGVCVMFRPG